ncbi:DUF1826 domain-containing protein [Shimia ponticola]|uniref:DUF1826 domain-containing protein n=1 Tax=Shimia ponticola TaxID=2582893 RepID=UPI00210617F1|nr:DUF1826 domain-containing protein [Shimia ponticola]
MSLLQAAQNHTLPGLEVGEDITALERLSDPHCAGALWQREVPANVMNWLAALDPKHLPSARVTLRPNAVAETVAQLCEMAGTPDCPERTWLEADINQLSETFATNMVADYIRLRLDVVTTNACRRWHIDSIFARLICTYRGTGTQVGNAVDGAEPTNARTTPTGAPLALRGSLWPEIPPANLRHRSPVIEGSGETRLLLVVDPVV